MRMGDAAVKNYRKLTWLFCACIALSLVLSTCGQSVKIDAQEHIGRIIEACGEPQNTFPSDQFQVEFRDFMIPTSDENYFYHAVRFANVSGQPLEVNILGFYNLDLDEYIIARGGDLQPPDELQEPVVIENNSGWVFYNTLTPLYDWDTYTEEEQAEIIELGSRLYFEIILEENTYYCILDFQNQEVITVQ